MPDNIVKIVSITEGNVSDEPNLLDELVAECSETATAASTASAGASRTSGAADDADDVFYAEPTISERCVRYLMVVIYLCGLCSLGFILSIYHFFFWDSHMPPVHKSMIIKKPLYMKP